MLKLKIKKCGLVRKVDGVKTTGYYGRVITNGKLDFAEVAVESAQNTTLHPAEAKLAAELLLDSISRRIKQGYIIDLGPLGTLYPAVSSPWKTDADELTLSDMKPRVAYRASDDVAGAVMGASLSWASVKEEEEADSNGTVTPDETPGGGDNTPVEPNE